MDFSTLFADYTLLTLLIVSALAFIAGFIDAVVGGGGLIQLPALLITLPSSPVPTIFGTNKIAALSGTSMAAIQYARRNSFNFKLLFSISLSAFIASYYGAKIVNCITNISALIVFIRRGNFIPGIAILMAVFNITGGLPGSAAALKRGNGFIRIFFLIIVTILILWYSVMMCFLYI